MTIINENEYLGVINENFEINIEPINKSKSCKISKCKFYGWILIWIERGMKQ